MHRKDLLSSNTNGLDLLGIDAHAFSPGLGQLVTSIEITARYLMVTDTIFSHQLES